MFELLSTIDNWAKKYSSLIGTSIQAKILNLDIGIDSIVGASTKTKIFSTAELFFLFLIMEIFLLLIILPNFISRFFACRSYISFLNLYFEYFDKYVCFLYKFTWSSGLNFKSSTVLTFRF